MFLRWCATNGATRPLGETTSCRGCRCLKLSETYEAGRAANSTGNSVQRIPPRALAVNTFGPWRTAPGSLTIGGISGFRSIRFEATCPIWPSRTPPHLDLLAEGDVIVAVESKCTEWMKPKAALFSDSYEKLRPVDEHSNWAPWFEQMQRVRRHSQLFDAAQVIKHAFGLLSCFGTLDVRLVYVYWEPRNSGDWPQCRLHREQADDLAARVRQSTVQLIPMSYRELWDEWQNSAHHLHYLRKRYDLEVSQPTSPTRLS